MIQHFDSKTVMGLLTLLATGVVMNLLGKLTPEMVEVIKWCGSSYMAVRVAANIGENMTKGSKEQKDSK
jgi:hypothetical protein